MITIFKNKTEENNFIAERFERELKNFIDVHIDSLQSIMHKLQDRTVILPDEIAELVSVYSFTLGELIALHQAYEPHAGNIPVSPNRLFVHMYMNKTQDLVLSLCKNKKCQQ
ncbi:hypothetical protein NGC36_22845 [Serratia rubidaea]|uniref:hypothetical protein n=1 Tax=Serratia rubidaea TaxID=61652 RepID=UPI002DBD8DEC|nr:hypothetical protein [Serratia rubidaea]MEB7588109.1 hypothetical protein [Serratia rubidaea]